MTKMSPFNSNHKQTPEIPMTSNTLHKLRHHLFIQLGAVLLFSVLIISAGAFYFVFQGNRGGWLLFGAGVILVIAGAIWLMNRLLKQNLDETLKGLAVNSNRSPQDQASPATENVFDGNEQLAENQDYAAREDVASTPPLADLTLTETQLGEIQEKFIQASQTNFEAIAVHNKANILAANQALATMFGYTHSEMNGVTLLDLVTPESRSTVLKNTVIKYQRPYAVIGLAKDGSTFPVEILSQALNCEEQPIRVIGIREVKEQGQAEVLRELQKAKEALESKVKADTAEIRNADERLRLELEERKRTEAELLQRNHELTVLQSAAVTITSSLDLRYVLDTVVREMVKLLNVESCVISAYNQEADTVQKIAEYNATAGWWDPREPSKIYHLADYPLTKSVLEEQVVEQMTISQAYIDPAELAFIKESDVKTLMMLPMVFQRQVVGLMELEDSRTERTFTHQEISLVKLMANQAASAIKNARLYQKAQQEIDERKQAEAALDEERALLAQRVSERTAELSKTNAELARAARLKDEFLAAMSHELRTPLNAILGSAEILRDEVFGALNDKQLKYSRNIEESGRHLLELINDILDLSKIEAGKMQLDLGPVSVKSVCEASLRLVKQLAHKKQLQVSHVLDPKVTTLVADERRLKQILVNLLSNAIKFTPEGGQLGLEVKGDFEQQAAHFTVWDSGIGIAEEDLVRLFQPFVQLDSKLSRQYAGTGLGLSLVSRMTEMHGGGIFVESEVGQGSRFTVSFPWSDSVDTLAPVKAAQPAAAERNVSLNQEPGTQEPLILLADDNEDNIDLIVGYLEAHQYRLVVARNGQEALDRAKEEKPDLILMDVQMPELDGLEATRRLRHDPLMATVPIIAVTALAMPGDRERCLAAGANEYLSKPVNLRGLVRIIETQLNRYRLEEEHSA